MPKIQIDFYTALIRNSAEIAKQLRIANELKALELKSAGHDSITPEMVDDIMEDQELVLDRKDKTLMRKTNLTLDDIKKESCLLVFMLNHEDSTTAPFNLQKDGSDFIRFGGTKNIRSLQSMLQALKRKGLAVNGSHGSWILTTKGVEDAEHWLKKCGRARVKPVSIGKDQTSLEEKLAMVEAELDGLRVEITMANHTNEYLDEQNNLLREENSKLKKKLELIQRLSA